MFVTLPTLKGRPVIRQVIITWHRFSLRLPFQKFASSPRQLQRHPYGIGRFPSPEQQWNGKRFACCLALRIVACRCLPLLIVALLCSPSLIIASLCLSLLSLHIVDYRCLSMSTNACRLIVSCRCLSLLIVACRCGLVPYTITLVYSDW